MRHANISSWFKILGNVAFRGSFWFMVISKYVRRTSDDLERDSRDRVNKHFVVHSKDSPFHSMS